MAYTREIDNHLLFHSEHIIFLSNLYSCKIVVNNKEFNSLVQAYFYLLAKETWNYIKAYLILKTKDPRVQQFSASLLLFACQRNMELHQSLLNPQDKESEKDWRIYNSNPRMAYQVRPDHVLLAETEIRTKPRPSTTTPGN